MREEQMESLRNSQVKKRKHDLKADTADGNSGAQKKGQAGKHNVPTTEQLTDELNREKYRRRYIMTIRNIIFILITAAAIAVLIATLILPVFRIYGTSMTPTLSEGEIVVSVKSDNLKQGDFVAFYFNNKILVKRVIAKSGEWVNIDESGNVYINDQLLDEPYLEKKSLGQCDIELPYQVPDGKIFVMGDHRDVSIDSRTTSVGCVSDEQIAGKLIFRIWPLRKIGSL